MKRFVFAVGLAAVAACAAFAADVPDNETPKAEDDAAPAGTDDAATARDGGGGRFCQPSMDFCVDFDGPNVGWDASSYSETYLAVSDGGLRATLPPSVVADGGRAGGVLGLVTPYVGDLRADAELFVERPSAKVLDGADSDDLVFFKILYPDGLAEVRFRDDDGDHFRARLYGRAGNTDLVDGGVLVPYGEWVHLTLEAQIASAPGGSDGGPGSAVLTIGREPSLVAPLIRSSSTGSPSVQLGLLLFKGETRSDLVIHYDNISGTMLTPP
jgi:hypothetical protein